MNNPLVSIIIPTYNSENTLPLCLKSIKKQTYKNIEIIVVDNYSKDQTVKIAKNYGAIIIRVRSERTKAKNIGFKLAKGKYVLFVDSDMELTPAVVEECVKLAEFDPNIGGIIIPERSVGNNYWAKVRDFERYFYMGTPIESPRFFRRKLVALTGGYDEDIIFYEEATLAYKIEELGYSTRVRINACILHHEENFSMIKWLQKKYYYGKTIKAYIKRYGNRHATYIRMQVDPISRLKLFFTNKKFWEKPHLAIGVLLLKILEYLVISIGFLTSKK